MGNFTYLNNGDAVEFSTTRPRTSTLELIRQYARVYTTLSSTAFSQFITN